MSTPRYTYKRRSTRKSTSNTGNAFIAPADVQRSEKDEKDPATIQRQALNTQPVQNTAGSFIPSTAGNTLPKPTQHFFQARMGADFGDVKIHTGQEATQKADSLNAKAYTIGNNIVFNKNQYDPESFEGRKLLSHELTHVLQQEKGGHMPQIQKKDNLEATYDFSQRIFTDFFTLGAGNLLTLSIDAKLLPEASANPSKFWAYLYHYESKDYASPHVSYHTKAHEEYTWKSLSKGDYQFILRVYDPVDKGTKISAKLKTRQFPASGQIAPTALKEEGSDAWSYEKAKPPYGEGTNKCNLFIFQMANAAGAVVPLIRRKRGAVKSFLVGDDFHPPLAKQWADPGFDIPGWQVVSHPQPGDVVAEMHDYSDATGHAGIVTFVAPDGKTGKTISASSATGTIVNNDWGFRPKQNVVFKRYVGR